MFRSTLHLLELIRMVPVEFALTQMQLAGSVRTAAETWATPDWSTVHAAVNTGPILRPAVEGRLMSSTVTPSIHGCWQQNH
jgi:hypothetical protein